MTKLILPRRQLIKGLGAALITFPAIIGSAMADPIALLGAGGKKRVAGGGSPPSVTPTTWNSADKSSIITLSASDLAAETSGANKGGVRTVAGRSSGKYYCEFTINNINSSTGSWFVGLARSTFDATSGSAPFPGGANDAAIGLYAVTSAASQLYYDGADVSSGEPAVTTSDVIGLAFDLDNSLFYLHVNGTYVNSGNPSSGTNGIGMSEVAGGGTVYVMWWANLQTNKCTANFGATAFTYSVPTGHSSGFGS